MGRKVWFEVWGTGQTGRGLLAKVKSEGTAHLVAATLAQHYKDVKVI